jgi:hypothetical protein
MIFTTSSECTTAGEGQGVGLNFKIIGGTSQPTNPVGNILWVETSVEITNWAFSYEQPAGKEGKIWIHDLATGQLTLDMLENNSIILSPTYCQQYINGQWVEKKAYVYQNSSWTRLNRLPQYIYNNGDQCESITGGWSTSTSSSTNSYTSAALTSDSMSLATGYDSKGYTYASANTKNKIDFDGYTTMTIRMQTGYPRFTIRLDNTAVFSYAGYNSEPRNFTVDVSKYSGKYSVKLTNATTWDDIDTGGGYRIYSIKLS